MLCRGRLKQAREAVADHRTGMIVYQLGIRHYMMLHRTYEMFPRVLEHRNFPCSPRRFPRYLFHLGRVYGVRLLARGVVAGSIGEGGGADSDDGLLRYGLSVWSMPGRE